MQLLVDDLLALELEAGSGGSADLLVERADGIVGGLGGSHGGVDELLEFGLDGDDVRLLRELLAVGAEHHAELHGETLAGLDGLPDLHVELDDRVDAVGVAIAGGLGGDFVVLALGVDEGLLERRELGDLGVELVDRHRLQGVAELTERGGAGFVLLLVGRLLGRGLRLLDGGRLDLGGIGGRGDERQGENGEGSGFENAVHDV